MNGFPDGSGLQAVFRGRLKQQSVQSVHDWDNDGKDLVVAMLVVTAIMAVTESALPAAAAMLVSRETIAMGYNTGYVPPRSLRIQCHLRAEVLHRHAHPCSTKTFRFFFEASATTHAVPRGRWGCRRVTVQVAALELIVQHLGPVVSML